MIKQAGVVRIALVLALVLASEVQAGKVAQIKNAITNSPLGAKFLNKAITLSAIALLSTTAITGKVLAQNSDISSDTQPFTAIGHNVTSLIPLYKAVRKLKLDVDESYKYSEVKELLETSKIDVNARDEEGNTSLHIMVHEGYVSVDLLKLLLDHGVDATLVDKSGKTAQAYVSYMHGGEPEAYIDKAFWTKAIYGINGKDADGNTPLDHAMEWTHYSGNMNLVRTLVVEGADISYSKTETVLEVGKDLLVEAATRKTKGDIASFLKEQHRHADMRNGEYLLKQAVEDGNIAVVEFLLDHGVILSPRPSWGTPPLFTAVEYSCWWGSLDMVSILLARGANGNDKFGDSIPYDSARRKTHLKYFRMITIPIGAATNSLLLLAAVGAEGKDAEGRTPMYWAKLSGSETIQKIVASEIGITKLFDRNMRQRIHQELREAM